MNPFFLGPCQGSWITNIRAPCLDVRNQPRADDTGQYRIPDLPPGSYKVTFTLPGFATVVREGVELSGGGVMTTRSVCA